jgi:large subunit ribosomal protein L6
MSRIAKVPVTLSVGVEVTLNGQQITVTGQKGTLSRILHPAVIIEQKEASLHFSPKAGEAGNAKAQAGTARSLVNAMVTGVTEGFSKKLQLVGVGYRAQVKEGTVHLSLGYSHPIEHVLPKGITAECSTPTEILVKGIDKQLVGQVAADLRGYRPPEPYKGKGVRYANETVRLKEAKKK